MTAARLPAALRALVLLAVAALVAAPEADAQRRRARPRVDQILAAIPAEYAAGLSAAQRRALVQAGRQPVVDDANGYLRVRDGRGLELELALFRRADGHYLVAVAHERGGDARFYLLEGEGAVWRDVTQAYFGGYEYDPGYYTRFRLPRQGRTIRIEDRGGEVEAYTWDGRQFVGEHDHAH